MVEGSANIFKLFEPTDDQRQTARERHRRMLVDTFAAAGLDYVNLRAAEPSEVFDAYLPFFFLEKRLDIFSNGSLMEEIWGHMQDLAEKKPEQTVAACMQHIDLVRPEMFHRAGAVLDMLLQLYDLAREDDIGAAIASGASASVDHKSEQEYAEHRATLTEDEKKRWERKGIAAQSFISSLVSGLKDKNSTARALCL
jgi:hypothetical protein